MAGLLAALFKNTGLEKAQKECINLSLTHFFTVIRRIMKETTRTTRSATRFKKNQRVEVFIKLENDTESINTNHKSNEASRTTSLDPVMKVEEEDEKLKDQISKHKNGKG